ncbi:hypothetical protein [Nannocystis pusilla]|uniref:hypothetical protein n=1 Tax=Nannocystis pusilla TaxID=889268 RepID=UPI003B81C9B0
MSARASVLAGFVLVAFFAAGLVVAFFAAVVLDAGFLFACFFAAALAGFVAVVLACLAGVVAGFLLVALACFAAAVAGFLLVVACFFAAALAFVAFACLARAGFVPVFFAVFFVAVILAALRRPRLAGRRFYHGRVVAERTGQGMTWPSGHARRRVGHGPRSRGFTRSERRQVARVHPIVAAGGTPCGTRSCRVRAIEGSGEHEVHLRASDIGMVFVVQSPHGNSESPDPLAVVGFDRELRVTDWNSGLNSSWGGLRRRRWVGPSPRCCR